MYIYIWQRRDLSFQQKTRGLDRQKRGKTTIMDFNALIICIAALWIGVSTLLFLAKKSHKLPPGPTGLPIVGSLFKLGIKPNESLAKLAKIHGPLMTLQLGVVTTVVVSSAKMAKEVLQKNDLAFAGRVILDAERAMAHHEVSVAWLSAGPRWRSLRRILNTHLFSVQRLDAFEDMRRQKVLQLVDQVRDCCLAGRTVDIGCSAFVTSLNLISSTAFSLDLVDPKSAAGQGFKDLIGGIMENVGKPNLADYFPVLRFLDPQGIRRYMTTAYKQMHAIFDEMIEQHLQTKASDLPRHNDLLDALLDHSEQNASEFGFREIKVLLSDLFIAGTDTNSTVLEWAMAELIRNPSKMEKARLELAQIIDPERSVQESDIPRLTYLQAVVKEAMRLHPPVPFLLPHRAETDVEIDGFTVPKHAQVLVNVWAISRDPENWENPNYFLPERFLGSTVDFRGQDMELIPFGAGRRTCPGLPLAFRFVHLMLASLLHSFSWKLPNGMEPEQMDMRDKFGITLQKAEPLLVIPIPINEHKYVLEF